MPAATRDCLAAAETDAGANPRELVRCGRWDPRKLVQCWHPARLIGASVGQSGGWPTGPPGSPISPREAAQWLTS